MIFTETVLLSAEDIKRYNGILDGTVAWPDDLPEHTETILAASVHFGDLWEMDVSICPGEPTPFVDAVLFHDGCECYAWDISEVIHGEWQVVLGDDIGRAFKLEIRAEEDDG